VRCFAYMIDVETHTFLFLRDLLTRDSKEEVGFRVAG
jgi:hypothetical protein